MAGDILAIDKPYRWTSTYTVEWAKRRWQLRKAGHAGTLDPLATGLLLVAVEGATKYIPQIQSQEKEYYALIILGYKTLSDDSEYIPEFIREPPYLSPEERKELMKEFTGTIFQRPPSFSAVKVKGHRAYHLARKGIMAEIPFRSVNIYEIEEIYYEFPHRWLIRVVCGKGTYLRSLARDIGDRLGCGAYLAALRRTRIGSFSVQKAIQPDAVTQR
ncbi:MAG: tRNA pseudouridine(55) synthase TruB [Bacteroidia bacterium]|nr:tRNA pseudouridine(55) synthase TruB [Bacteroidia bacterium]MDW8133493.1 tRNA pseudouridine(55) synthase TruB [Bacteroidia bacterium]